MPAGTFNDFESDTRPDYKEFENFTEDDINFLKSQFEKQFSGEIGWEQNKAIFWPKRDNIKKFREAMALEYSKRLETSELYELKTRPNWIVIRTWVGHDEKLIKFIKQLTKKESTEYINILKGRDNITIPSDIDEIDEIKLNRQNRFEHKLNDFLDLLNEKNELSENMQDATNLKEYGQFAKKEVEIRDKYNEEIIKLCKMFGISCPEDTYKTLFVDKQGGKKKVKKVKKTKKSRKTHKKSHKKTRRVRRK